MTDFSRRMVFWAPRVLSLMFILYLSLFALDVFTEGRGFWRTLAALLIHLIPSFVLVAVTILAWRWEWVGAALFGTAGLAYILMVFLRPLPGAIRASWIAAVAGPALVIALLYMANWLNREEIRRARRGYQRSM